MTIEDYKIIRNKGKTLAYKILDYKKSNREDIIFAGKVLGFWDGAAMAFDKEEESDVLMDYLIYEKNKHGNRLINSFYDSKIAFSDLEEEILQGQVDYHSSLFEIVDIDTVNCEIILTDLLDKNNTVYKLMDLGLSQTGRIGLLVYTRLIPIRDINMTSGVSFGFVAKVKDRILNDILIERFKKRRKLDSTDLFILTHKKSKIYGLDIVKIETT